MADQSPRVKQFLAEIVAVCVMHKLVLCASAYDDLQVWELEPRDDQSLAAIRNAEGHPALFANEAEPLTAERLVELGATGDIYPVDCD